jgi:tRNA threonylcarbamoyl adenosine modification protein (Sua5/YciO/YrdC/YwlC family)
MTALMDFQSALDALAMGDVVALPTDTVYGVAASLGHPIAVATLFSLKHRPASAALPVLVSSIKQIEALGVAWPERARTLSDALWPGALTIVVAAPLELCMPLGSTMGTIGFRCPRDDTLLALLERSGPLALTSANEHGEAPCESAAQVVEAFAGRRELSGVLDGGERSGKVSTVIDLSDPRWRIVRDGAVPESVLAPLLN